RKPENRFRQTEIQQQRTETAWLPQVFQRTASDIDAKQARLKQAIAATLEESLCDGGQKGKECEHHGRLVKCLKSKDEIISFNYDCLIDESLKRVGTGLWNARYGYGFDLGKGGSNLSGDSNWMPESPATKRNTVKLYKLHGSLHFHNWRRQQIKLKQGPYT